MAMNPRPSRAPSVLVFAPFGRDAEVLSLAVTRAGASGRAFDDAGSLCDAFGEDTDAVILTEEGLAQVHAQLAGCLARQPVWSDVPVLMLAGRAAGAPKRKRWDYIRRLGNVAILERPMHEDALVIALDAAVRSRAWQYMVRDQMRRLEAQAAELERRVDERTRALHQEMEERRRIEDVLQEARRMEAVGRLTGGVAHDFNNLLQVITVSCNLLSLTGDDPRRRQELVDGILSAAERGGKLNHQLLAFARRQTLSTEVIHIDRRIRDMDELLRQSLREKIALDIRLEPGLWDVRADAVQLEVGLLNLAINAKEAMPAGGTVVLLARNVTLPIADVPATRDLSGDFVCLTLRDSGPGMPDEVAAQAFEPFFTTKGKGSGAGMGLSQVYGFARQSGGTAWIGTGEQGTAVSIVLPRGDPSGAGAARGRIGAGGGNLLHGTRVLCVEDDPAVRDVALALLSALGCRATGVAGADEALRLPPDDFDLVFSDVMMPGSMDGVELARCILTERPGLPVLLTSGYVVAPERLDGLHVGFLAKPYNAASLRTALGGILEQKAAASGR